MSVTHFRYAVRRPFRLQGRQYSPHAADPALRILPEDLARPILDNLVIAGDVEPVLPARVASAEPAATPPPPAPSGVVRRVPPPTPKED